VSAIELNAEQFQMVGIIYGHALRFPFTEANYCAYFEMCAELWVILNAESIVWLFDAG